MPWLYPSVAGGLGGWRDGLSHARKRPSWLARRIAAAKSTRWRSRLPSRRKRATRGLRGH